MRYERTCVRRARAWSLHLSLGSSRFVTLMSDRRDHLSSESVNRVGDPFCVRSRSSLFGVRALASALCAQVLQWLLSHLALCHLDLPCDELLALCGEISGQVLQWLLLSFHSLLWFDSVPPFSMSSFGRICLNFLLPHSSHEYVYSHPLCCL